VRQSLLPGFEWAYTARPPRRRPASKQASTLPRLTPLPQTDIFALSPSLFPLRRPRPAARIPVFGLAEKDRWGEWVNAHDEPSLLLAVERLPNDYDASVAFIRSQRPREAGPALQFWGSPFARAHFMNGLLLRRDRTLTQVQRDMDVTGEKIYAYLPRWGVEFHLSRRDIRLQDADGQVYEGVIEERNYDTGVATVLLGGYSLRVPARFIGVTRSRELIEDTEEGETQELEKVTMLYSTSERVAPDLLPYRVLSLLSGYTDRGVRLLFPESVRARGGNRLVSLTEFMSVVPPAHWQMSLDDAKARSSTCRCVFWDLHQGACGIGNLPPLPGETCEDHQS
jgi:hypothetical protein